MNPDTVHEFWFGAVDDWTECAVRNTERRFLRGGELDAPVSERFAALLQAAARGEVDHWMDTPRGAMSLIFTLDQFPRHIHRGNPQALQLCLSGVESGLCDALSSIEHGVFLFTAGACGESANSRAGCCLNALEHPFGARRTA